MKVAPILGIFMVVGAFQAISARPVETDEEKELKQASLYILGNLNNAAVSQGSSKAQAASDRNESEWNSTEMLNTVSNDQKDKEEWDRARVLVYAGGDASNLAISYQASEAQSSENDQKSGYNNQNLGMGVELQNAAAAEDDEDDEMK